MSNVKQKQYEWSYLAGFLDADGSIYIRVKPNTTYRFDFQISPNVVFFQSSKERKKIEKIQEIFKVGYLRDRKDGITEWIIGDQKSIILVMEKTLPFLKLKKKQALLMLEVLNQKKLVKSKNDFVNLVGKIDKFKELNYSKKRKNDQEKVLARLKFNLDIKLKRKVD